jgi:hypothetical protein
MGTKGVRGALATLVEGMPWLANKPQGNVGFSTMWAGALVLDSILETARQGLIAPWPGYGTPTALSMIGQMRQVVQGIGESQSAYAARLRAWLDTATNWGSDTDLAQAIQSYLQTDQRIRIVDRSGNWTTLNSDGSVSFTTGTSLNWDSISNPWRSTNWSDIWVIIYDVPVTAFPLYNAAPGFAQWVWGQPGGVLNPNSSRWGHKATNANVAAISQLVKLHRGAHTFLRSIIWSYDATLFDPNNLLSLPDGTWGNWSKTVNGVRVQSRSTSARYWDPSNGAGVGP